MIPLLPEERLVHVCIYVSFARTTDYIGESENFTAALLANERVMTGTTPGRGFPVPAALNE